MKIFELARWQYGSYTKFHGNKTNLWLHIIAVPLFQFSFIALIYALPAASWFIFVGGLTGCSLSMLIQGIGHKKELNAPVPFTDLWNIFGRIVLEQFYSFPRFVFSGCWLKALREK
jgi:Protein of unknown function (DUF962)